MTVVRQLWLLLLPFCLSDLLQPSINYAGPAIIAKSLFELSKNVAIVNGSIMTEGRTPSVMQCAAKCVRLSGCGGFNHYPNSKCITYLRSSLQFSFRREEIGARSGTSAAYTCRQRRLLNKNAVSGPQQLLSWPVPVYCDQQLDGGGWTLLVSAVSGGWYHSNAIVRNEQYPSITENYSMMRRANKMLHYGDGVTFNYRLEGQAQTGRQQWGAIFSIPQPRALLVFGPSDQIPTGQEIEKFGDWNFGPQTIGRYLPYIDNNTEEGMLMRTQISSGFGTILSYPQAPYAGSYSHSPWINSRMEDSGTVLYWVREN